MTAPEPARHETARLAALRGFEVLDTPAEPAFDRLTELARDLFGTGMAVVSLIDETRQWFKSRQGIDGCETDRNVAFCDHAIRGAPHSIMVVPDAAQDERFRDNPSVIGEPFVRFYAGAVLTTADGHALGTLCVFDSQPREGFGQDDQRRLRMLADMVMEALEQRLIARESDRRRGLLEMAEKLGGLGSWRLDAGSSRLEWSRGMYGIYGFDPDQPLDLERLMAMTHPEDAARAADHLSRLLGGGEAADEGSETRIYDRQGGLRYLASKAVVERGTDGAVATVIGMVTDVTAQHEARAALAESEQRYRTLAEHATDILVRFGADGLVRYISPACRKLGVDPEAAIGRSIMQVIAFSSHDHSAGVLANLLSGDEIDPDVSRHHCVIDSDGREVWLEGSPNLVRDETGQVVEVVTVLRDVTARHRIEQALAESEARYRHLADMAPDTITESRLDGTLTYISPASTTVTGFTPQELLGRSSLALMSFEDAQRMQAVMREVLASGDSSPAESIQFRAMRKDGSEVWLESKPTVYRDPRTGKRVGFIDVLRDISAHKALEESLDHARADAEAAASVKADFLANMSHELRTPLTAVLGFSRLVAEQPELGPETRGYVERLSTAGKALLSTVNDILDFSKLEAGQVEIVRVPADPAEVVGDAVALFEAAARDKGIMVAAEGLEALPPRLSLDPDRLRQILLNLIGNAVKFTEAGGVTVKVDWADGHLICRVVDTGPGVPADRVDQLFQRFSQVDGSSTRRHGGAGLGLAICRGLAEAMGGRVGVRSVLGQGSTFWFSLPAQAVAGRGWSGDEGIPPGTRILLADDNRMNRELVRVMLSGCEVELTEATDGLEAALIAQSAPFDLILMDLRMPRLDGESAAWRIRDEAGPNTNIPIVGFSADPEQAGDGVFDAMLGKPVEAARLLTVLAHLLNDQPLEADDEAA